MQRMGADISCKDGVFTIHHAKNLKGANVDAGEIRAGVALLGLGLMAKGTTVINNADNILRGYDRIVEKMRGLSVDIELLTVADNL